MLRPPSLTTPNIIILMAEGRGWFWIKQRERAVWWVDSSAFHTVTEAVEWDTVRLCMHACTSCPTDVCFYSDRCCRQQLITSAGLKQESDLVHSPKFCGFLSTEGKLSSGLGEGKHWAQIQTQHPGGDEPQLPGQFSFHWICALTKTFSTAAHYNTWWQLQTAATVK